MQCVTDSEIDKWLRERSIPRDPYCGNFSPALYLQFHAPTIRSVADAFISHYYERIVRDSDSLVEMTDWGLYQPSEMVAVMGIRSSRDENRMLADAPGHLITSEQQEVGISLFSLSASFSWSSYLYSARNHSTLFNWEGEIFDFWTESEEVITEMTLILNQFNLTETNRGE